MMAAPVALFVYNRPLHTRQTIEALLANAEAKDTDLYVFSDAAKNEVSSKSVSEVRAYIHQVTGFHSVTMVERQENLGLAVSIISGVTEVCQKHGRIIVLEDDLVTSPYFLRYMNDALDYYEKDERVISISGYSYPVKEKLPETFFLLGADCWGWATWSRGWSLFEQDGRSLLDQLIKQKLADKFDLDRSYPYTKMLKDQIAGKNNSWAIRWYASAFLKKKLTLYPGTSLVLNIGMDNSGTHCSSSVEYQGGLAEKPVEVLPITVEEGKSPRQAFIGFHRKSRKNLFVRVFRKLLASVQQ